MSDRDRRSAPKSAVDPVPADRAEPVEQSRARRSTCRTAGGPPASGPCRSRGPSCSGAPTSSDPMTLPTTIASSAGDEPELEEVERHERPDEERRRHEVRREPDREDPVRPSRSAPSPGSAPCRGLRSMRSPSRVGIPEARWSPWLVIGCSLPLPLRRTSPCGSCRRRRRGGRRSGPAPSRRRPARAGRPSGQPAAAGSPPPRPRSRRPRSSLAIPPSRPYGDLGRPGRVGRDHLVGPEQLGPAGHLARRGRASTAASSIEPRPSGYQGSMIESWPQATFTPGRVELLDPGHARAASGTCRSGPGGRCCRAGWRRS